MQAEQYDELTQSLLNEAAAIERMKRPSYTVGSDDVLANFKNVATRLGITPRQALAVYWLKHVDAITSALKDPEIPQGEQLLGRFADNVNYLKLAYALVKEEEMYGTI